MPIPKPTPAQLKDPEGKKEFISVCMGNDTMVKDYEDNKQRAAICYYAYDRAKKKSAKGSLALKINEKAVTKANVKIKTGCLKESKEFVEPTELAASYLEKNGIKKYGEWFLSVNPNEDDNVALAYTHPITTDFMNVDIKALEKIMELAGAVNDRDLSNKAAELLEIALKKQNGQSVSTYQFFVTESGTTLEATI